MPSPIASIPPEILGHIFFLVSEETLTVPSHELTTLFHVTQTCSTWRAIVLRHPRLWADLNIHLRSWSDRSTINAASLCLQYSSNVAQPPPLSIRIHIKQYLNYWESRTGISTPIFLIPHVTRIHKLSIYSPLLFTPLVFPRLTDLEVSTPGWDAHADMHIPALLGRSGSTVTRLSVGCVPDWDWFALLENTPRLEVLITEGTLPEGVMRGIALGRIGVALKELRCAVVFRGIDILLEILETRLQDTVKESVKVCLNVITNVSVRCVDFVPDELQWTRIQALGPSVEVTILVE
ncbi:hypothetical protein BDZ94DRAFT_1324348 [Collybia nuda]|uniref:F-box domain-containing protein n=1 Tax=Collybia nuda TaxID=64659 RepID=A0A9P5Y0F1_9AGAR|nr:hypothetical protein BDZ94DRAFT_1324348 [Collybia nuda]